MRDRLPDRRRSETLRLISGPFEYVVTCSYYHDGRLGEVFLDAGKDGTDIQFFAHEIALALSFAFQNGASIDEMRNSVPRTDDGEPQGIMGVLLDFLHARIERAAENQAKHQAKSKMFILQAAE